MTTPAWIPRPLAIFVDTSAFFASINRRDANHANAIAAFERSGRERIPLITSNFIRTETHALILTKLGSNRGRNFLSALASSRVNLVRVNEHDETRALSIIATFLDKTYSLTDATSFAVMERLGLRDAFSFDSDFSQYGFRTLPDTSQEGGPLGPPS